VHDRRTGRWLSWTSRTSLRRLAKDDAQRIAKWILRLAETPLSAAERDGIGMLSDIALRQALAHGRPQPAQAPRKQQPKAYRIVLVFVNTAAQVGDVEHFESFVDEDAAERGSARVVFEYPVIASEGQSDQGQWLQLCRRAAHDRPL